MSAAPARGQAAGYEGNRRPMIDAKDPRCPDCGTRGLDQHQPGDQVCRDTLADQRARIEYDA